MDESNYLRLASDAFSRILNGFDEIDSEDADVESAGDVITITFGSGKRCVINTQRPTQQIWMAGGQRAWHFSYDATTQRWLDDKGSNAELFTTLQTVVSEAMGVKPTF